MFIGVDGGFVTSSIVTVADTELSGNTHGGEFSGTGPGGGAVVLVGFTQDPSVGDASITTDTTLQFTNCNISSNTACTALIFVLLLT